LALNLREMDLVEAVWLAVLRHQGISDRHQLRFEAAVPVLIGGRDGGRLDRVIGNLVSNAIKYSPDGGDITVGLSLVEDRAELVIEDNDLGIPETDLPHIFERFRRAGNVVGRIPGSGLGLAGAMDIVQQHGGSIRVESVEGHGSRFIVQLPTTVPRPARKDTA
jgi:signal transduction histidine kinase